MKNSQEEWEVQGSDENNLHDMLSGTNTTRQEDLGVNPKILAIRQSLQERALRAQQEELRQRAKEEKIRLLREAREKQIQEETPKEKPKSLEKAPSIPKKRKKKKKKYKYTLKPNWKPKKSPLQVIRGAFPEKGDSVRECIRKCVFLMAATVFMVCLCMIGDYFWENYQNSLLNDELRLIYNVHEEEEVEDLGEGYEYYGLLSGVESLLAINPEVVGWISIPDTEINYPILQHKDAEDGNEYYLTRNIYGETVKAGSIFLDYRNNFDYVINGVKQVENSQNLIIYGHNMADYSMFGGLKYYINYADYYSEHPIIELNSNYRTYKYKIFAMILVDVDDETDTAFDYWNTLDFSSESEFYDYVNEIKRRTIRLTDVDVTYGDQLLTLSTCNSTFSNGRLVVFARLVRDDEELYEGTETSTLNPNIKWPSSYYKWHSSTYDPDADFEPYG